MMGSNNDLCNRNDVHYGSTAFKNIPQQVMMITEFIQETLNLHHVKYVIMFAQMVRPFLREGRCSEASESAPLLDHQNLSIFLGDHPSLQCWPQGSSCESA